MFLAGVLIGLHVSISNSVKEENFQIEFVFMNETTGDRLIGITKTTSLKTQCKID